MIFRPFYAWAMAKKPHTPDLASNPKAKRDYHMVELFEAGIVLRGTEVKSLRAGRGEIKDAFARVEHGEVWLYNAHIEEYRFGNWAQLPNRYSSMWAL